MKKKHENIIWNMYENMKQVPLAISGQAAQTSTSLSYISAYKDMEVCWEHFLIIMECIKNIESLTNTLRKYENDDIDTGEIQSGIDWNTERMEDSIKKFNVFIKQRKIENWR